jgi:hypothetical protein
MIQSSNCLPGPAADQAAALLLPHSWTRSCRRLSRIYIPATRQPRGRTQLYYGAIIQTDLLPNYQLGRNFVSVFLPGQLPYLIQRRRTIGLARNARDGQWESNVPTAKHPGAALGEITAGRKEI